MGGIKTGGPFEFYRYNPSVPAAALFIVLFSISTIIHGYQLLRKRCWMMIPFVIGGLCESVGYVGRIVSSHQAPDYTVGPFLLQGMLILWGPSWFAASIYMCLGRIARITGGESYCLVRPSILTVLFVSCDYIGLAIQGIGSGIMAAGPLNDFYAGSHIVVAGLAILVASFGFFVVLTAVFDVRMQRNPPSKSQEMALNWRRSLISLYVVSALIFIRSTCRLVEYAQGNAGWLMIHEWTFYVFDSVLMITVMVVFNWVHPSKVVAAL